MSPTAVRVVAFFFAGTVASLFGWDAVLALCAGALLVDVCDAVTS